MKTRLLSQFFFSLCLCPLLLSNCNFFSWGGGWLFDIIWFYTWCCRCRFCHCTDWWFQMRAKKMIYLYVCVDNSRCCYLNIWRAFIAFKLRFTWNIFNRFHFQAGASALVCCVFVLFSMHFINCENFFKLRYTKLCMHEHAICVRCTCVCACWVWIFYWLVYFVWYSVQNNNNSKAQ